VSLDIREQSPLWAVEVKWSDHAHKTPSDLENCVEFVNKNPKIAQPILVTSQTITDRNFFYKGVRFMFQPASVYAYELGANLLQDIDHQVVGERRSPHSI
jgi:uncharacterized protein